MIRPPHSPIVDSPILDVPEEKTMKTNESDSGGFGAELEYVKKLLDLQNIDGFEVLYPGPTHPNIFTLRRKSASNCPLCKREHSGDNAYIVRNKKTYRYHCYRADQETPSGVKKPSLKLVINETVEDQEKTLPIPEKIEQSRISDSNDHFIWGDLLRMCMSKKKFTRDEAYSAIQATIACVEQRKLTWIVKLKNSDGLYFDMGRELELAKHTINIIEHGGEAVKLQSLIDRAVTENLIHYDEIDFLPYPPNVIPPKTNFFNLFLGFAATPAPGINKEFMDPILWHVKNVICDENNELIEYIWNWWAFLVQKPEKKPRSICVLKSTLQQCGKNIIIDFIGDKVLGPNLYYATSDLGKILGKFNSLIQGKKLVVMNETGMASGEWHKFNEHLKALITEPKVSIERKGLEPIHLKDYSAFMVTSNQDAPIKIDAGDACIVCFDVSACCRGNIPYFKRLAKILEHPDAPGVVMRYLLNRDLSNWDPQDIPSTKMKTDTMMKQLSNPIRFVIQHISSWSENQIEKPICGNLYQNYITWCESNGEGRISNNKFGGFLPPIGIEKKQVRVNGKRESVYIIDHSKIVAKLHESIGDIKDFELETHGLPTSDISQDSLPTKTSMEEIPVFNVPETKEEENEPEKINTEKIKSVPSEQSNISCNIKTITNTSDQNSDTNCINNNQDKSLDKPVLNSSKIIETLEPVSNKLEISSNISESDKTENAEHRVSDSSNNEEDISKPVPLPSDYLTREQREKRLRQWAIDHGEDPDKFMTITEKDINLSTTYRDRMMSDADMIQFAKETDDDPDSLMNMTRRERLISEEIYLREWEEEGIQQSYIFDDEEWKKNIAILQENGYLR
ncbi:4491_t:CDS:1 [Entrophospora sp. SA101]|nr:4491_t:CDS:1 [Entrophospora sp. SA101]